MRPVSDLEASDEIRQLYTSIRLALNVPTVPLFFTYLANYPVYFTTIVPELLQNLQDEKFHALTSSVGAELSKRMKKYVPKDGEIGEWLNRYQYSPSMYHMRKSLMRVHEINTSLAFISLALREAVKGWAIAASKLDAPVSDSEKEHVVDLHHSNDDFVYKELIPFAKEAIFEEEKTENSSDVKNGNVSEIVRSSKSGIEQNLYVEYLHICEYWFSSELKKENYLYFRVISEKAILLGLNNLPHPIYSPINRVIDLVPTQKNFMDICLLLSEHFPTTSMQRVLFSGYMSF